MNPRLLLSCQKLGYYAPADSSNKDEIQWEIYDLNWDLFAGERIQFHFENEDQKQVLWRLLQQNLKPKTGSILNVQNSHLHTDESLWKGLNLNSSIMENLRSKLFEERPWFSGKRLNLEILLDRLALRGKLLNVPVDALNPEQKHHFWVLMLVAANTNVLLLDKIFQTKSPVTDKFLKDWLYSFTGAVVAFRAPSEELKPVFKIKNKVKGCLIHQ